MQCLTYVVFVSLAHYYRKKPCQQCITPAGQLTISLVHLSSFQTNDCGLWPGNETTYAMHTTLENGILRNGQQPSSAADSFFDHGKFEAMKTLSGY